MSIDELEYMSIGTVFDYLEEYIERLEQSNSNDEGGVIEATQHHFDTFMGGAG